MYQFKTISKIYRTFSRFLFQQCSCGPFAIFWPKITIDGIEVNDVDFEQITPVSLRTIPI